MSEPSSYKPPEAVAATGAGKFNASGRMVEIGRGWDWIADAWRLFTRQPSTWIADGFVFLLVTAFLPYFPPVFGSIASMLITPAILGGLMIGAQAVQAGDPLRFGHLFDGFQKNTGRLLCVGLIWLVCFVMISAVVVLVIGVAIIQAMVASAAGADVMQNVMGLVTIIMGSLMTILLGLLIGLALLVPVAMMLWFAPALIVLHDMGVSAALKASFIGCLKNFIPFLLYGIVMLILCFAAALPLMLGYLVLVPVIIASVYTAYRDIYIAG